MLLTCLIFVRGEMCNGYSIMFCNLVCCVMLNIWFSSWQCLVDGCVLVCMHLINSVLIAVSQGEEEVGFLDVRYDVFVGKRSEADQLGENHYQRIIWPFFIDSFCACC